MPEKRPKLKISSVLSYAIKTSWKNKYFRKKENLGIFAYKKNKYLKQTFFCITTDAHIFINAAWVCEREEIWVIFPLGSKSKIIKLVHAQEPLTTEGKAAYGLEL